MPLLSCLFLFVISPGNEGICSGTLLGSATCLLHSKLTGHKLDCWIKSSSQLLSDSIAKHCNTIFTWHVKGPITLCYFTPKARCCTSWYSEYWCIIGYKCQNCQCCLIDTFPSLSGNIHSILSGLFYWCWSQETEHYFS